MVGRGNHDRVDILAVKNGPEILDARHITLELRHLGNALAQTGEARIKPVIGRVEIGLIDVAQSHDLRIGLSQESP